MQKAVLAVLGALLACSGAGDTPPAQPARAAATASQPSAAAPAEPAPAAANSCLSSGALPPYRSTGTAHLTIAGAGINVSLPDAPALCGSMYVQDMDMGPSMRRKAGDGMLFETCAPEGMLQVTMEDRTTGVRDVRAEGQASVGAVFNSRTAGSFLLGGTRRPTDKVTVGADRMTASVRLTMNKIASPDAITVTADFTCRP